MYDIPRYHTFTFCRLIHKLYFCRTLKNKMATINDLKAKLIQEDKLMSIERINEIREKNILSYIKSTRRFYKTQNFLRYYRNLRTFYFQNSKCIPLTTRAAVEMVPLHLE